ncbi:MAG: hypothetical protein IJT16_06535 [Lachnospiraceae bacterium]|nr:hypothetical protein [Lachnospiraceae bacterium]
MDDSKEKSTQFDLQRLTEYGIDLQAGFGYTGGEERYISALKRYYKAFEGNKQKLREYLDSKDLKNLTITFHSVKSNSKMIGALYVAEGFEALEAAAKNEDMDTINAELIPTLKEYDRLIEVLKPFGESETMNVADELSAEEARETAKQLLAALDDFDEELAAELAEKLSGYPFRITQRGKLREAAEQIGDFMYDNAADLIREILEAIE